MSNAGKVQCLVTCKSSVEAEESYSVNVNTRVYNRDVKQYDFIRTLMNFSTKICSTSFNKA